MLRGGRKCAGYIYINGNRPLGNLEVASVFDRLERHRLNPRAENKDQKLPGTVCRLG